MINRKKSHVLTPLHNHIQLPSSASHYSSFAYTMDDDPAVAELERQKALIDQELKKRQRAALQARRDEEDRQLIAAGEGIVNQRSIHSIHESHSQF